MKEIFDIKRFWKYFKYDLVQAKNNTWVTILVLCLLPLIFFVVVQAFCISIQGEFLDNCRVVGVVALSTALVIAAMIVPAKLYGGVTDKAKGSSWLMVPASTLEKWLSVFLMTCVVLPAAVFAGFLACDSLMSLIFKSYGTPFLSDMSLVNGWLEEMSDEGVTLDIVPFIWYNWAQNVLVFTLGALIFKKSKVGMTILSILAVSTVFGIVSTPLVIWLGGIDIENDALNVISQVNWVLNVYYLTFLAVLLAGVYARLKTLKH